jgi:hypothetical protein
MKGVIMDNKNIEKLFEKTDEQIEGIVLYLLRKYAVTKEFSPQLDTDLKEECEI